MSLDPSTLYRGTIPYEKIAFSSPPPRLNNPSTMEMRKVKLLNFYYFFNVNHFIIKLDVLNKKLNY